MNTNLDNMNKTNDGRVEKKVQLSKIAIDMHLKSFRVVRQMDHGPVQPAQRFEPPRFCAHPVCCCSTSPPRASTPPGSGTWERWCGR